MHINEVLTDDATLAELGRRLEQQRLNRNLTQQELADLAGVGRATLQRLEGGRSVQATSMIRVLRALNLLAGLDAVVPASEISPIAELERERRRRRRAGRPRRRHTPGPNRTGEADAEEIR